jgi:hypothetical protein
LLLVCLCGLLSGVFFGGLLIEILIEKLCVNVAKVKVRKFVLVLLVCLVGISIRIGLVAPQLGDGATELCPFKFF